MNFHRAGLILALSAGVGLMTITASAQDKGAQDQHKQAGQKPAAHASKPAARPQQAHTAAARPKQTHAAARPQQTHTAARPKQTHAAAKPQQTHTAARPKQNHTAARPQQTHAAHPQPNHTVAQPQQSRNRMRSAQANRQPNRGAQARPNYQFRSQDTSRLRQYYQGRFSGINRRGRPSFSNGGYIPRTYWGDFQPVPASLLGYLPAVPPGYAIGYYDGYIVVYDPTTYLIISVLNILQ